MSSVKRGLVVCLVLVAMMSVAQVGFAQERAAEPTTCALETCPLLVEGVQATLSAWGAEAEGIRFDIDPDRGLVADILTRDLDAILEATFQVESSTHVGISGGAGAGKVKFDKLSIKKYSGSSTAALYRVELPVAFPEGLTVLLADGTTTHTADFLDVSTSTEGAALLLPAVQEVREAAGSSGGGSSEGSSYECWWVEDELVCWCTGGGSC